MEEGRYGKFRKEGRKNVRWIRVDIESARRRYIPGETARSAAYRQGAQSGDLLCKEEQTEEAEALRTPRLVCSDIYSAGKTCQTQDRLVSGHLRIVISEGKMIDSADLLVLIVATAVWWIAASVAVANAAGKRGLTGGIWFLCSLVFGPIFAVLLLIARPVERPSAAAVVDADKIYNRI
jgi:hypothetical protein